jgi:hypothetical protein
MTPANGARISVFASRASTSESAACAQLLRRGGGAKLRHRGGVLRLLLLADVIRYRDGGEYPNDQNHYEQFDQSEALLARPTKPFHPP